VSLLDVRERTKTNMATEQQIASMLTLMQQQMEQLQTLHIENAELRNARKTKTKTKTPDRPTVNANIDEKEWELFKDTWNRYKTMTGITDVNTITIELRATCSPDVNKLLFEFLSTQTLDTATEANLLTHMM